MALNIEPWFIPFDIFMIICIILVILLALLFLIIIIIDKACHKLPMILIANSCLAEILFSSNLLSMAISTLTNDRGQNESEGVFCILQGYLSYVGYALQNYCFLLQAFFHYMIVAYPTHLYYQTIKFQSILIGLVWIFSFVYSIPFIVTNQIKYNISNQICQMSLGFSFFGIYTALCIYGIPISLIVGMYFQIVRHVSDMTKHVLASTNLLFRAKRELKMIRRIVILLLIIITIGLPYEIFSFMAFFTSPPKYYLRITFLCVDVSLPIMMITLFIFTEPLQAAIKRQLHIRHNLVATAVA